MSIGQAEGVSDPFDDDRLAEVERKRARAELREHRAMLRWMLSQKPARRFLGWLLYSGEACNAQTSVFDRDPVAMAFKSGVQHVGLGVQAQLQDADFGQFQLVLAEFRALAQNNLHEVIDD